ncbi:MAG: hypothetical protein WCG87_08620 [Bacteroidota bacterium]
MEIFNPERLDYQSYLYKGSTNFHNDCGGIGSGIDSDQVTIYYPSTDSIVFCTSKYDGINSQTIGFHVTNDKFYQKTQNEIQYDFHLSSNEDSLTMYIRTRCDCVDYVYWTFNGYKKSNHNNNYQIEKENIHIN